MHLHSAHFSAQLQVPWCLLIEPPPKKFYANNYKYGIKIIVQKKGIEKVYLFDIDTIDVKGGITTVTTRKFAISSIA